MQGDAGNDEAGEGLSVANYFATERVAQGDKRAHRVAEGEEGRFGVARPGPAHEGGVVVGEVVEAAAGGARTFAAAVAAVVEGADEVACGGELGYGESVAAGVLAVAVGVDDERPGTARIVGGIGVPLVGGEASAVLTGEFLDEGSGSGRGRYEVRRRRGGGDW